MKLTEAQHRAVFERGSSLLVGAAAGSGKTTVLSQRVLSLLTDKENPIRGDRFAAVTFTNAAAAELRVRIELGLSELLMADPGNSFAARQLQLSKRAAIGTIHSFCGAIAREFSHVIDIPPDFSVADEFSVSELSAEAIESATARLYEDKASGYAKLCALFGRSRSDREAQSVVLALATFFENIPDPDAWVKDVLEHGAGRAREALFAYAEQRARLARILLSGARDICTGDPALEKAYIPALESDIKLATELIDAAAARDYRRCSLALSGSVFMSLKTASKDADPDSKRDAKLLRDRAKNIISDIKAVCFLYDEEELSEDESFNRTVLSAAYNACLEYQKDFFALKNKAKVLSFADLERCALLVLQNPAAREELRSRYDALFVDEFQDVNPIQSEIFRLITEGRGNLFAVGDIKQSIYRFRHADPGIFLSLQKRAEKGGEMRFLPLSENFRSSEGAINAVNAVFESFMSEELGGVDYKKEKLIPGVGAVKGELPGIHCKVLNFGTEPEKQAAAAAELIKEMLQSGYPVEDRKGRRPCKEGDFCLMFRSSTARLHYEKELEKRGIRFSSAGGEGFFDKSHIAAVVALLSLVLNGSRDVEAAAVMLSPLFGFTPDDLARLKLGRRRVPLLTLAAESDNAALADFASRIFGYRSLSFRLSPAELLEHIYDDTSAELLLTAGADMAERMRDLRLLLSYAEERSAAGDDLRGFLRLCERARQEGKDPAGKSTPPKDAVTVTTIHGSKGLEWPFVLFCESETLFNTSDSSGRSVLFDEATGFGSKARDTDSEGMPVSRRTLSYAGVSRVIAAKDKSEEMRVLYVALTRARQKTFVFLSAKDAEDAEKRLLMARLTAAIPELSLLATSHADWILAGCMTAEGKAYCRVDVVESEADVGEAILHETAAPDTALAARLMERWDFRNKYESLSSIPAKTSVTGLVKGKSGSLRLPNFSRHGALSGAERGTALHLFMECANYRLAAADPKSELQRLLDMGYIDRRSADAVDTEKIAKFFRSSLADRILKNPVLREYEFIQPLSPRLLGADIDEGEVLVQGIADCVILEEDGAVIVDYKTDRVTHESQLIERYAPQLELYREALAPRLARPVKSLIIYSFSLDKEIVL